jgi:competence protein ComEA
MKRIKLSSLLFVLMMVVAVGCFSAISMAAQEQTASPTPQQTTVTPATAQTAQGKININTASAPELEKLSGIGPAISQEIVKYRESNGPFKSPDDIKQVKGVGDKKFEAIKDKISVE